MVASGRQGSWKNLPDKTCVWSQLTASMIVFQEQLALLSVQIRERFFGLDIRGLKSCWACFLDTRFSLWIVEPADFGNHNPNYPLSMTNWSRWWPPRTSDAHEVLFHIWQRTHRAPGNVSRSDLSVSSRHGAQCALHMSVCSNRSCSWNRGRSDET